MARRRKRLSQRIESATRTRDEPTAPPPIFGPQDEQDPAVELAAFVGATLIGLLIIIGLAILFGVRSIEGTLEDQTVASLRGEGLRDIEVQADGLDLTMVGTVRHEGDVALAIAVGYSVEGVRSVDAENVIYVPLPPEIDVETVIRPLVFTWDASGASVSGTVSNEATRQLVAEFASDTWEGADSSGLAVEPEMEPESDWLPTVLQVVAHVGEQLQEGTVIANSGSSFVLVNGELETRAEQLSLRRDVEDILSALTFTFTNGLTVKEVALPPTSPPVGPTVEVTTTTIAPEVIELQETLNDLIEDKVVEFDFGSADITSQGRALLDEILVALDKFPGVPVQIAGHTDNIGSEESNLLLSRLRAAAVLSYLVDHGQPAGRFEVIGYGETQPIADNDTPEGRARNRRIEFIALSE